MTDNCKSCNAGWLDFWRQKKRELADFVLWSIPAIVFFYAWIEQYHTDGSMNPLFYIASLIFVVKAAFALVVWWSD
jgi:signal peptidase I